VHRSLNNSIQQTCRRPILSIKTCIKETLAIKSGASNEVQKCLTKIALQGFGADLISNMVENAGIELVLLLETRQSYD
jgi:hypothetical protein